MAIIKMVPVRLRLDTHFHSGLIEGLTLLEQSYLELGTKQSMLVIHLQSLFFSFCPSVFSL